VLVIAFLVVGKWDVLRAYWDRLTGFADRETASHAISGDTEYFCPMCPGVLSDWPSKCPVCNMALVRRKKGEMAALPDGVVSRMQLSPYRIQLAGIKTSPLEFQPLCHEVHGTGELDLPAGKHDGPSRVRMKIGIRHEDWPVLAVGQEAEATSKLLTGRASFRGRVVSLSDSSARQRGAIQVELELDDPRSELRPDVPLDVAIRVPLARLPAFIRPLHDEWRMRMLAEMSRHWIGSLEGTAAGHGLESLLRAAGRQVLLQHGYVPAIPESAVIDTGSRTVAYVESSPGTFDGVEVTLGPRCNDVYPVLRGLEAGQRVATAGAFLIDAESKLNPSIAASYFGATRPPTSESNPAASSARLPGTQPQNAEDAEIEKALLELSAEDRALAKKQKTCPVTGQRLGSMGTPAQLSIDGRRVLLCCEGCEAKFKKDPKRYLALIDGQ
jgi:hypothetical protein